MGKKWTEAQEKVINTTGKNILVSAAAGSGKTAVLVARIIKMITDEENPVDIDRLVIITFTRAAAAQMRKRISDELGKLIESDPLNPLYRRQQRLLGNATISTIDSFCLNIIRSYFQKADLDPAFRMADETELKLIESEAMDEMMEKYHTAGSDEFYYLIEAYCNYKSDEKLTDFIYQLSRKAGAQPWPFEFLDGLKKDYEIADGNEFICSKPVQSVYRHTVKMIKGVLDTIDALKGLCVCGHEDIETGRGLTGDETDLSSGLLNVLKSDYEAIKKAYEAADYTSMGEALRGIDYVRLSSKKDGDPGIKEIVKDKRDKYKKKLNSITASYYSASPDELAERIKKSYPAVSTLIEMAKEYLSILEEKKKEKNVIDFSDAEHLALNVLWGDTPEALELKDRYSEIIIDEYQDSNNVQEYIANAIAGSSDTKPYVFTVGDVKQSIYKFRNARPELFMEKQKKYANAEDNGELIILDNNFRSREEVLSSTNAVFKHIMREEIGGIDYNDECSLKKGTDRQKSLGQDSPYKTEVLVLRDSGDEEGIQPEDEGKIATEARLIAKRIKKLIFKEKLKVPDEENEGAERNLKYSDIVILLRTMKDWAAAFSEVFESEGIPVFAEQTDGFFKSGEVRLVIDFLKVLDNPRQDIPFAAVLHSVVAGLSEEELAEIKVKAGKTESFYDAAKKVSEMDMDDADTDILRNAADKLKRFFGLYEELKEFNETASVSELIGKIYDRTDIYYYYTALPGGEQRKANLDMLPGYAVKFESTSYSGLFSFIRYYEKLESHDLDYGEEGAGAAGNAVRIMSIHKSKGLEFPVVFVSGMGKQFNLSDFNGDLCVSADNGLGIKYVDIDKRIKYPSFYHAVIRMCGTEELIGEEMRLLYVAMTRAKDKVILTGYLKKPSNGTDYAALFGAKCFMDFVYPVLFAEKEYFDVQEYSSALEMDEDTEEVPEGSWDKIPGDDKSDNIELSVADEEKIFGKLTEARSKEYPYKTEEAIPVKLSVSDLKHMEIEEEFGENVFAETRDFQPGDRTVPDFLKEDQNISRGTDYGTLVHKCMQFIPMNIREVSEVEAFFTQMEEKGRIASDERSRLNARSFTAFLSTPLADRIRKADALGKFYREKQFMILHSVSGINALKYGNSDVKIPVQGVIDAMFVEDGKLVILDYKTDRAAAGEEDRLVKLYKTQLDVYAEAAAQLTGLEVKEKLLYSFSLGKEIEC